MASTGERPYDTWRAHDRQRPDGLQHARPVDHKIGAEGTG